MGMMTSHNNDHHDTPSDDLDHMVLRALTQLGPLMRRKAWADTNPPDEAFARELERWLTHEGEPTTPTDRRDDLQDNEP